MRPLIICIVTALLNSATCPAATFTSEEPVRSLPAFVDKLAQSGYLVLAILPAHSNLYTICETCYTQGGQTVCVDPSTDPPPQLFCHDQTETVSVLVVYQGSGTSEQIIPPRSSLGPSLEGRIAAQTE